MAQVDPHVQLDGGDFMSSAGKCDCSSSAKFDWEEVVNKPFVKTYWDEIVMLASVDGFADMFQLKEDGKYLICLS